MVLSTQVMSVHVGSLGREVTDTSESTRSLSRLRNTDLR